MKFTTNSNLLQNVIQNAYEFCSQKVAITSFVLLELKNCTLTVRSTDSKMGYSSKINVNGEEDGTLTISCDKFLNLIKAFSNENIVFEKIDNEYISLKSENKASSFKLRYNSSSSFPEKESIDVKQHIDINGKTLLSMIEQSIISVNETNFDNDAKVVFNGVLLETEGNIIKMVSTDGKSMSFDQTELIANSPEDYKNIIIPSKFLRLTSRIIKPESQIKLYVNDTKVFIKTEDTTIFTNLYKGVYPNYKKVLDTVLDKSIIVKKDDLSSSLKRVSIMTDNISKKLYFTIENNIVKIDASDNEFGSASDEIETTYEGEKVQFAINSNYITNQVKVINSDFIKIEFKDANTQVRLSPTNEEKYLHIIMPMSL